MKKLLVVVCFAFASSGIVEAQKNQEIEWPGPGRFRVDTIYNKKDPYKLVVTAGGCFDMDMTGGFTTPLYFHARYILLKHILAAVSIQQGLSPISAKYATATNAPMFGTQELRAGFTFSRKDEPSSFSIKMAKVTEGDHVTTYSAPVSVVTTTYYFLSASIANMTRATEMKETSTDHYKWTLKDKSTGAAVDTNQVMTTYNMQQISGGIYLCKANKFKGKFYLTYADGRHRKKTGRKKMAFDIGMEMLFAPTITVQKTPWSVGGNSDPSYVSQFEIDNIKYKRMGFRFLADMKMSIFSIHWEMGTRPGPKGFPAPEDRSKFIQKACANMYLQMGFGVGIGAL